MEPARPISFFNRPAESAGPELPDAVVPVQKKNSPPATTAVFGTSASADRFTCGRHWRDNAIPKRRTTFFPPGDRQTLPA
jgi:hypothetical protein